MPKFVWWKATLISLLVFLLLFYPSYLLLEIISPINHRPYDFGGANLEKAVFLAFFIAFLVNMIISKNKKIISLLLFLIIAIAIFVIAFGV